MTVAVALCWPGTASAQTKKLHAKPGGAEDVEGVSAEVNAAEDALDRKDYAAAESQLLKSTAGNPHDARAWFDLGLAETMLGKRELAIDDYRKAAAADPRMFEVQMNLGLLLAGQGDRARAVDALRTAVMLKPQSDAEKQLARAWMLLGDELGAGDRDAASAAYASAAKLEPADVAPHMAAGKMLEATGDPDAAAKEYRAALQLAATSTLVDGTDVEQAATMGLVRIAEAQKRIEDAESLLKQLLAKQPQDASARIELARLLTSQGKKEEAATVIEEGANAGSKASASGAGNESKQDPELLAQAASLEYDAGHFEKAARAAEQALAERPDDWRTRQTYGLALMHLKRFKESENQIAQAITVARDQPELYSNFAAAANEAGDFGRVVGALDARAQIAAETPGTLFLRAIAYDHLGDYKNAAADYHRFLEAAGGKLPNQEWQARHRLVAIEPKERK